MTVPTNEEPLRRVAHARYRLDLQGALRRAMVNSGSPHYARRDVNGICVDAFGKERAGARNDMLNLTTAPCAMTVPTPNVCGRCLVTKVPEPGTLCRWCRPAEKLDMEEA